MEEFAQEKDTLGKRIRWKSLKFWKGVWQIVLSGKIDQEFAFYHVYNEEQVELRPGSLLLAVYIFFPHWKKWFSFPKEKYLKIQNIWESYLL